MILVYRKKKDLEEIYGLPVYTSWSKVPEHLYTKSAAVNAGFDIEGKKPTAIKSSSVTKQAYYLYDIRK